MLKFESLEIIGFKSFCEKTRVLFDDRTTCVIGPNGCGKSNLSDAIAWVLGAQNARTLRSDRMEDLIFNGTAKRKPSGVSEITLTIKRTDEKPIFLDGIELTGDRLEITRRLFRSGESAYLINQKRCRLKDIHQFMEDAALGFASYAMIAQGNIESFLSSKPMERRSIIEEAAGIVGYKSRRKSAELKLELAQQNLLRVNDIVVEVERQLRSLKRQAAKARRYRELKDEFRQLQFRKFALEGRELGQRLLALKADATRIRGDEEAVRLSLSEAQEKYRVRMETRERLEKRLTDVRQSLASAHLEFDRAQNSIQYHEDQIEALGRRIEMSTGEQEKLGQSLQAVNEELERFRAEQKKLGDEEQAVEQTLGKQKDEVTRYGAEVQAAEQGLEKLRTDYVRLTSEAVALRNSIEQIQQRRALAAARKSRLEKERETIVAQLKESQNQLAVQQSAQADKQKEVASVQSLLEEQERLKSQLEERLAAIHQESDDLERQVITFRERLHSLQEIELSHSQYSEGVQKFLNHLEQTRAIRTAGTLAESIEASPEYERLVEEVLDAELEYVLVDSLDEAVRGVAELKSLKGGKCTFLSLQSTNGFGKQKGPGIDIQPNKSEGVHGTLLRLLQMSPEVEQAFKRVLPERAASVVVSDLDRAFALSHTYPEQTFLTLDGESLTPRGLLSATASQSAKVGLLALKRQKKELEKKLGQTQVLLTQAQKNEERTKSEQEAVAASCVESQSRIHTLEKEAIALEHQRQQREGEMKRLEQAAGTLNEELRQISDEDAEHAEQTRRLQEQLSEKTAGQVEMDRLIADAQGTLQQLRVEFSRVQEQLHLIDSDRKVMGERRLALHRTLQRVEEQRAAVEARVKSSVQSQAQDRAQQTQLSETLANLRAQLTQSTETEAAFKQDLEGLEAEYGEWRQAHPAVEQALAGLRDQAQQIQEARSRCEIEQARLETQLENAAEQCLDQLQQPLAEVMAQAPEESTPAAEIMQAYSDLRTRLDEFGPINMTALEEYQENETRYEFLTRQKQDIEQSIADTTSAIQEINRRSREKFRDAFTAINAGFKEVFVKLFGGGDCGIQLIGDEDPLEAGIDIYAQPPGKKVQNVMLLSGGEKAMTVLSLLVALFHYRPSQFCVLDEVDAPLDDTNVGRFTNLVRDMSDNTQFIIITHNKRTMEIANYIYGVTMEEPGVSQVVSVKFPQAADQLAS